MKVRTKTSRPRGRLTTNAKRPAAPNPLRLDPSRTGAIRKAFAAELSRRFARLRLDLAELVVTQDAFGLKGMFGPWALLPAPDQLTAFGRWLDEAVDRVIFADRTWLREIVAKTYLKGAGRAFDEQGPGRGPSMFGSPRQEFLRGMNGGLAVNAFCPTGQGGGVDPTCSPKGGAGGLASATPLGGRHDRFTPDDVKTVGDKVQAKVTALLSAPNVDANGSHYLGQMKDFLPAGADVPDAVKNRHVFYDPKAVNEMGAAAVYSRQFRRMPDGTEKDVTAPTMRIGPGAMQGRGTSGSLGDTFLHEVEHAIDHHDGKKLTEYTPRFRQMMREFRHGPDDPVQFLSRHGRDNAEYHVDNFFAMHPGHTLTAAEKADAVSALLAVAKEKYERPPTANAARLTPQYRGAGGKFVTERVKLLAARLEAELKGATLAMAQKIARELADGLDRGKGPNAIAAAIRGAVDGIGKARALLIAETEVTRFHAEGQLDAMEAMGVEGVTASVEWTTRAGACPLCKRLEGKVMKPAEARGLIPKHPRCRCSWSAVKKKVPPSRRRVRKADGPAPSPGLVAVNAFCPTGKGGGVDPSCTPKGGPSRPSARERADAETVRAAQEAVDADNRIRRRQVHTTTRPAGGKWDDSDRRAAEDAVERVLSGGGKRLVVRTYFTELLGHTNLWVNGEKRAVVGTEGGRAEVEHPSLRRRHVYDPTKSAAENEAGIRRVLGLANSAPAVNAAPVNLAPPSPELLAFSRFLTGRR